MDEPWVIALAIALPSLVAVTLGVRWLLRRLASAARTKLAGLCPGRAPTRIDDRALFFGLASGRAMQARGNGLLALFDAELVFVQFVVDRVVRIPLGTIVAVDEVGGFRGKTIARPLLHVRWRAADRDESAAWYVDDLGGWRHAIGQARSQADASATA